MRKVFDRYLTITEERKLFATVKQFGHILARRDYAWMRFLRQTGLRVGTMSQLTVNDAREALHTHYLQVRPEIAKRGIGGQVYVTQAGRKALTDLLRIRREQGHAEHPDAPLVMSRQEGKGMAVRSYQHRMAMWVRQAGLNVQASPHWFRHTLAKRIMKNSTAQDPRGVVQGALLQRSANSTAVYTMPDREDVEQVLEEVS